ncbi:MAG: hypothetical protein DMD26_05265, partial [Gemmatimonadetes bacterium]
MRSRFAAVITTLVIAAPSAQSQANWPTRQWPTATPQSVGVNAAVLDSINAEIAGGKYGYIDRMIVIRHGRLVYDRSYKQ